MTKNIPILMYHNITDDKHDLNSVKEWGIKMGSYRFRW